MANRINGTYEVDPVSRIEGHLGVKVTTDASGIITDAKAHGNLWRGFENFLLGRNPNDAITFVQRICGVCPVPHGMTSTYAIDNVMGYSAGHITFAYDAGDGMGVPKKAVHIRNLVLGMEFLMSSITHFYHLAAPSYIQGPAIPPWTPYFADANYSNLAPAISMLSGDRALPETDADGFSSDLWSTVIRSYVVALRIRRLTFEAAALFAGRMPMTSVYVGGGVTFDGTEDLTPRIEMFENLANEVGLFIIQEYVPIALALSLLYPDYDNTHNVLATGTGKGYGSGLGRYLAWGAFPNAGVDGTLALPGGLKDIATPANDFQVTNKADVALKFLTDGTNAVPDNLTEDIDNSRYSVDSLDVGAYSNGEDGGAAYPGDVSRTHPNRASGYTYMKAPRWHDAEGNPLACEVGPLARLMVAELIEDNELLAVSLGSYYQQYAINAVILSGAYNSLDPAMIHPDIAVAVAKAGLANVKIGAAVYGSYVADPPNPDVDATAPLPATGAAIVAAYTNPAAEIVGPIADHVIGLKAGASIMDRLRARALESLYLIQNILGTFTKPAVWGGTSSWAGGWCADLRDLTGEGANADDTSGSTWRFLEPPTDAVSGWGGTEAPRGALMHTVSIDAGKITKYQCIVPTTWNGSPIVGTAVPGNRSNHGAIEAACIGLPFADAQKTVDPVANQSAGFTAHSGVEVLRAAQSFDPCIACAVH